VLIPLAGYYFTLYSNIIIDVKKKQQPLARDNNIIIVSKGNTLRFSHPDEGVNGGGDGCDGSGGGGRKV
jgi:hypothetical protein